MKPWRIDRCRLAGAAVAALGALFSAAGELPRGSAIEGDPVPLTELRASLAASPADEVVAGERLVYTITVTNVGAPPLSGVTAVLDLPGESVLGTFDPGCEPAGPLSVRCDLGEIPAGGGEVRAVAVRVRSSATGSLTASLEAWSAEGAEDADRAVTGVRVEARLALLGTAASETVFVGETIALTFRVTNGGPSDSPGGELTVFLPPALVFAALADGCEPSPGPRRVRCPVPPLPAGRAVELGFTARALGLTAGPVTVIAQLLGRDDPTGAHAAVLTITVLAGPELVLPFFEVAAPAGLGAAFRVEWQADDGATTLLAVQNLTAELVRLRLDYLAPDGAPLLVHEGVALCGGAVHTVNLRDLPGLFTGDRARATGYVRVTRIGPAGNAKGCPPPAPPAGEPPDPPPLAALAGDFLRIDPDQASASGGLLVATDPARHPRELCRRWSVRFSLGEPFGADTELVFWVADNPRGRQPVVRGRVYTDDGDLFREVAVATAERAFTRRASEFVESVQFSPPTFLLSGTIEWSFPEGVVGHVAAVLEPVDADAASVPGTCLDPRPPLRKPGRDHPLVLPFFDLDPGGSGEATLVTVRNEGDPTRVVFRYFDAGGGDPILTETCFLAARAVRTVDLRDFLGQGPDDSCTRQGDAFGLTAGYLEVLASPDFLPPPGLVFVFPERVYLSGDYVRTSADGREAAGGALLDTDPALSPPRLCRRWSTRLVHGPGAETDFVFFSPAPKEGEEGELVLTGTLRDETGGCLSVPSGQICLQQVVLVPDAVAFQVGSGDQRLGLGEGELFGTVEWTFPAGRPGHVTTRFRSPDSFAVAVPGICLEP